MEKAYELREFRKREGEVASYDDTQDYLLEAFAIRNLSLIKRFLSQKGADEVNWRRRDFASVSN
jgi:hypothetical protein